MVVWGDSKRKQHNEWDHKVNHSIINMRTQPTSDDSLISTTTDKKFNQAKQIYAIAGQFTDATGVLEDLCTAVCDCDYSWSKLLQDVAFVKKFVIPLLKDSINTITTAARILSPIAGVKYVHDRNENKRKLEVAMFKNSSYSLPKEMIVRHVTENQNNNKLYSVTPPAKRSRRIISPTSFPISNPSRCLAPWQNREGGASPESSANATRSLRSSNSSVSAAGFSVRLT